MSIGERVQKDLVEAMKARNAPAKMPGAISALPPCCWTYANPGNSRRAVFRARS